MEILKQGDAQRAKQKKLRIKRFVCDECGCEFKANKTEYKEPSQMDYCGDRITAYCKCPCCGNMADTKR